MFKEVLLLILTGLILFLGGFVYWRNKKHASNLVFAMVAVCVGLWPLAIAMFRLSFEPAQAVFWARMIYLAGILIGTSFLAFAHIFPEKRAKIGRKERVSYFLPLLVMTPLLFSSQWVAGVDLSGEYNRAFLGPFYKLWVAWFISYMGWALFILYLKYRRSTGATKNQVLYVLLAFLVPVVGSLPFNIILPLFQDYAHNYRYIWFGPIFLALMLIFIAYAIIKHRLLDIKFVLKKSAVYVLLFAIIILPALFIKYITFQHSVYLVFWTDLAILIAVIILYPALSNFAYSLANKYFFTSLYNNQEVIAEVSDNLRSTLHTTAIYEYVYSALDRAMHMRSFAVLSFSRERMEYCVEYNRGFEVKPGQTFQSDPELYNLFVAKNRTIVMDEINSKAFHNPDTLKTLNMLRRLQVEVLTPLNIKSGTVGMIALGPKESGDMYNHEDLNVLEIVGAQAAIAIENAWLFEETRNFNQKLKDEVEKATRDLRQANEKLKRLDAAKSEFISIASHQLRTPLTVIKGYISMILEGSFGRISATQKQALDKVYESSERLIQLIENLLNISRIESGRLQYTFEPTDLAALVKDVVDDLKSVAKKKGLRFTYNAPQKQLPKLQMDEEKMRQVVMNMIDNSIKYTKKGSVTVSLKQEYGRIKFCVQDTGIGISQEQKENLFKKFSRGSGPSLIHTEGTGLGLYVAKQIVEAHKGRIWAESRGENQGSCFCFSFKADHN